MGRLGGSTGGAYSVLLPFAGPDVTGPIPTTVTWTDHALAKAHLLGIPIADVEDALLADHERRTRNSRAADWLLRSQRLVIAYNYPAGDDQTALVVTLWRRG